MAGQNQCQSRGSRTGPGAERRPGVTCRTAPAQKVGRAAASRDRSSLWPAAVGEAPPLPHPLRRGPKPVPGPRAFAGTCGSRQPDARSPGAGGSAGLPKRRKTPCPRWWRRQSAGEPCSPARSGRRKNQQMGSRARRVLADRGSGAKGGAFPPGTEQRRTHEAALRTAMPDAARIRPAGPGLHPDRFRAARCPAAHSRVPRRPARAGRCRAIPGRWCGRPGAPAWGGSR